MEHPPKAGKRKSASDGETQSSKRQKVLTTDNFLKLLPSDIISLMGDYAAFDDPFLGRLFFFEAFVAFDKTKKSGHAERYERELLRLARSHYQNFKMRDSIASKPLAQRHEKEIASKVKNAVANDGRQSCRFCGGKIYETGLHAFGLFWKALVRGLYSTKRPAHEECLAFKLMQFDGFVVVTFGDYTYSSAGAPGVPTIKLVQAKGYMLQCPDVLQRRGEMAFLIQGRENVGVCRWADYQRAEECAKIASTYVCSRVIPRVESWRKKLVADFNERKDVLYVASYFWWMKRKAEKKAENQSNATFEEAMENLSRHNVSFSHLLSDPINRIDVKCMEEAPDSVRRHFAAVNIADWAWYLNESRRYQVLAHFMCRAEPFSKDMMCQLMDALISRDGVDSETPFPANVTIGDSFLEMYSDKLLRATEVMVSSVGRHLYMGPVPGPCGKLVPNRNMIEEEKTFFHDVAMNSIPSTEWTDQGTLEARPWSVPNPSSDP